MTPLITVVIPTYNNEKFIAASIDSCLSQTYNNIEIIIIDDGSTDNTGKICDEYKTNDDRIRVIHKVNGGVSAARNTALTVMNGKYVTFIDGDDTVSNDYVENLYNAIEKTNADISTSGHFKIFEDGTRKSYLKRNAPDDDIVVLSGISSLTEMFYGNLCYSNVCCKLFKKEIFDKKFNFPTDLKMGEDSCFTYKCMSQAKKVAFTNKLTYFYLQQNSSVTNKKSNYIKFYDYVKLDDWILRTDCNLNNKVYRASVIYKLIENNLWVLMKLVNDTEPHPTEIKHIEENIKKYRKEVLLNKRAQTKIKGACALSYLGFDTLVKVYNTISK